MANASPVSLDIQPGIVTRRGPASAAGRYVDGDKVRFKGGRAEKIGGWVKAIATTFTGLARGALGWTTVDGSDVVAFGTAPKVYSASDEYDDITPIRASGQLTDPFDTTDTETTVEVTHTAHGLDDGATVIFDNATAVGGITIDGAYLVTVVDADNYTIEHSAAATSTATGGGTVDYEYEINPGLTDTVLGLGYGAGAYGAGTYGTPRTTGGVTRELRQWFFSRYGTHLMVLPSGGGLYKWDQPGGDDRAVIITNAPTSSRAMFVTAERFPVLLGTIQASTAVLNPMHIRWPDVDDITAWTPTSTNTANARTLQSGNKLMAGTVFSGTNLVWSDTSLYVMQYLAGSDFIYETRVIGQGCGLIAPAAFAVTPGGVVWMSADGFFIYNGAMQQVPRFDEIATSIFPVESGSTEAKRLNKQNAAKVYCVFNRKANEVWWGYPSADESEPDRYVAVSLEDWSWHFGTLARTAATYNDRPNGDVVMFGTDSYIYLHEVGKNADGAAMEVFIESDYVSLGDGATDIDITGYVPVFDRQVGTIELTLTTKDRPMSSATLEEETFDIEEGDEIVDIYLGGRYAKQRLASNEVDGDFRLGVPVIEIGPGGEAR